MTTILKTTCGSVFGCTLTALTMVYLVACGSKPEPGPRPKPPWPDSPSPPSLGNPRGTIPSGSSTSAPPLGRNRNVDVALIALADVWVLVKPEGQNEIWKNLREGERLVIPKTGKMAITYSSGKSLRIEAGGRVIKPHGGNENVGFLDLD